MSLGFTPQGDFNDFIKYDARSGRFSRVDQKEPTDITQGFSALFDLAQIDVGWVMFAANSAPEFTVSRVGQELPARPTDKHKRGFRMKVKLAQAIGGDCREFSSAAGCVIAAIDDLHSAYESAPEAAKGMLPLVTLTGSTPVKTNTPQGSTTNYRPIFSIVRWLPRPADMPIDGAAPTNGNGHAASAPKPVVAPARVAPVQAAPVGADTEF